MLTVLVASNYFIIPVWKFFFLFARKELQAVFHQTVYHRVFTVFVQSWVV